MGAGWAYEGLWKLSPTGHFVTLNTDKKGAQSLRRAGERVIEETMGKWVKGLFCIMTSLF